MRTEDELVADLDESAIDRAEQAELAGLLADHFRIESPDTVSSLCAAASWRRLGAGDVLLRQGDPSDAVYILIRGRLVASRLEGDEDVEVGLVRRGEIVGEVGLLDDAPRNATLTASRDSVLARLGKESFFGLLAEYPRLVVDIGRRIVRRSRGDNHADTTTSVLGLLVCDRFDGRQFGNMLCSAMPDNVTMLTADRVESQLGEPGISTVEPTSLQGIKVGKLVDEAELNASHLLLDAGQESNAWSHRVTAMADRVLVVMPTNPTSDEVARTRLLLQTVPSSQVRTLVVLREDASAPTGTHELMDRLEADDVIQIRQGSDPDMGRLARLMVGSGTGLVLGGGGARGIAHLGVYRALDELGVAVDAVGGTSMGSILGVGMADEYPPSEWLELVRNVLKNIIDYTIPMVALTKGARIARAATDTFGDRRIEDLWRTFFCLSTNLTTSRSCVHRRGAIATALRASASIPGVMPPVPYGRDLLVDGGVLNNLPIDVMRQLIPAGDVIAVDVAPVRGPRARSDFGLSVSGWSALRSTMTRKRTYPPLAATLMRSLIVASQRERDLLVSRNIADCYLDLDLRGVSLLKFDDVHGIEKRGYEAAMPRLEAWLEAKENAGGS